ncbi:MAG: DUF2934 domain-containing protein [Pirellulaceae bacterium]|nr:DUF2934 domain-containing protein [Pirellulaceae bacterium]
MPRTILKGAANRATSEDASVADPKANMVGTGAQDREEAIRALAHSKWEAAECPAGDGLEFWLQAEREIEAERSGRDSTLG